MFNCILICKTIKYNFIRIIVLGLFFFEEIASTEYSLYLWILLYNTNAFEYRIKFYCWDKNINLTSKEVISIFSHAISWLNNNITYCIPEYLDFSVTTVNLTWTLGWWNMVAFKVKCITMRLIKKHCLIKEEETRISERFSSPNYTL